MPLPTCLPCRPSSTRGSAGPYVDLAGRLGHFAAHLITGNPTAVRLTYFGKIAELNTSLLRNAGLAGVLNRSTAPSKANVVNAMQLAADRGWNVAEVHDKRSAPFRYGAARSGDRFRYHDRGRRGRSRQAARLMHVDGILLRSLADADRSCWSKNLDVPGVVGHIGTIGSRPTTSTSPIFHWGGAIPVLKLSEAMAVVTTDTLVPQKRARYAVDV